MENGEPDLDTFVPHPNGIAVQHLVGGAQDALGQAEAEREVDEVGRRRQHHRVGDAVVDQRNRHLFDDPVQALTDLAVIELPHFDQGLVRPVFDRLVVFGR